MAELYPYPRFSIAERDRRWKAVRDLMRRDKIDVIVTPQNSGHSADYQADTRYLTHCGGGEPDVAASRPLNSLKDVKGTPSGRPRGSTTSGADKASGLQCQITVIPLFTLRRIPHICAAE